MPPRHRPTDDDDDDGDDDLEVLTPHEVAARTGLHLQTVYKLLRTDMLRGSKVGRHWLITKRNLRRSLRDDGEEGQAS